MPALPSPPGAIAPIDLDALAAGRRAAMPAPPASRAAMSAGSCGPIRRRKRCCGAPRPPASASWPIWAAAVVSSGLPLLTAGLAERLPASTATRPRSVMRCGAAAGCPPDSPSPISPRRRSRLRHRLAHRCPVPAARGHAVAPARTRGHGGPKPHADPGFDPGRGWRASSASPWNGLAGRSAVTAPRSGPLPLQALAAPVRGGRLQRFGHPLLGPHPACRTCCCWPSGHRHERACAGPPSWPSGMAASAALAEDRRGRCSRWAPSAAAPCCPTIPRPASRICAACCCPG